MIVKILASAIEFFAGTALALSLFRIPLNYKRIALIAVIISLISTYFRFVPELMPYHSLSILVSQTALLIVLFYLPIFYSILITVMGLLLSVSLEYAVVYAATELLHVTTIEEASSNVLIYSLLILTAAIIIGLVTYFFQTRKIGFMFMAGRFSVRQAVRAYNFSLSAILIVCFLLYQLANISVQQLKVHGLILIGLSASLLIALYISFKQNKKFLVERYERNRS